MYIRGEEHQLCFGGSRRRFMRMVFVNARSGCIPRIFHCRASTGCRVVRYFPFAVAAVLAARARYLTGSPCDTGEFQMIKLLVQIIAAKAGVARCAHLPETMSSVDPRNIVGLGAPFRQALRNSSNGARAAAPDRRTASGNVPGRNGFPVARRPSCRVFAGSTALLPNPRCARENHP